MEAYKIYYTDVPQKTEPDMSTLNPLQCAMRQQAINTVRQVISTGAVVWQIEEPDGTKFNRPQIKAACRGDYLRFNAGAGSIIVTR